MKNKFIFTIAVAMTILSVTQISQAKEEKTIVGYIETTTITNERDAMFHKIDTNKDGYIDFKEFQRAALLSNEYSIFVMNDTNNDKFLSIDEYRNFSKQGPAHGERLNSTSTFNFNKSRQ